MPALTRTTIRLAMVYLILGLLGWTVYWMDLAWDWSADMSSFRPISIHFITVGWLTQLIFAVVYWMFPIVSRDSPRGKAWITWFGCLSLNLGLIFRAVFEFGLTQGMGRNAGWGLVGAGLLQWCGATAWVILSWQRIREHGGKG